MPESGGTGSMGERTRAIEVLEYARFKIARERR